MHPTRTREALCFRSFAAILALVVALTFSLMVPATARAATTGSDGLTISGTPAATVQIGHLYTI